MNILILLVIDSPNLGNEASSMNSKFGTTTDDGENPYDSLHEN